MFLLAIILVILGYLIWWFTRLDCDLEVLYALKFGKPIDVFRDKVIWVTGSSNGVGEQLAYVLASVGAKLVISGTDEKRVQEVAEKCVSIGKYDSSNVLPLAFDIADCDCHQENFDKVLKHFGKFDILVNNAGRSQRALFLEIEPEVDRQLFAINVFGLVNLTRVVLRYLLEYNPDGQIGVTSSTCGLFGVPNSASYTGSKHALHGYFECLRNELGTNKIAITIFCIGSTVSNSLQKAFTGKAGKPIGGTQSPNVPKMSGERCAQLMAVALANKIDQAWIAIQPILTFHYASQYFPQFFRKFAPKLFTSDFHKKLRDSEIPKTE